MPWLQDHVRFSSIKIHKGFIIRWELLGYKFIICIWQSSFTQVVYKTKLNHSLYSQSNWSLNYGRKVTLIILNFIDSFFAFGSLPSDWYGIDVTFKLIENIRLSFTQIMMYTCLLSGKINDFRLINKILISKKSVLTFNILWTPYFSGILLDGNKNEIIYEYLNSKD